jgi:REP element-mobilizing transposase RayT
VALAYHLIWTCYGQWLPGDTRGSVPRDDHVPGTPYAPADTRLQNVAANAMAETRCWLADDQRRLAAEGIREACRTQGWGLPALNVQPDHVHALLDVQDVPASHAMRVLKTFATRRLREVCPDRRRWWTKGGKVEPVGDQRHMEAVKRYIAHQPFEAVS